jgi:murein DD-endopeptidase MepM/ murein hydrolase activator NlpD
MATLTNTYLQQLLKQFIQSIKLTNPNSSHFNKVRPAQHDNIQAPIKGTWYSSGGFSLTPTDKRHPKGHLGVDLRASAGTPIYPMMPGVVTYVGTDPSGGNVVKINHNNGIRTYYAHCATIKVQKNDYVNNNTVIATVGDTGSAKGTFPHLHFQVWRNNQIQDPATFFNVPKYTPLDSNKESFWISEQAKQETKNFDINKHVQKQKIAHSDQVEYLITRANIFCKLFEK